MIPLEHDATDSEHSLMLIIPVVAIVFLLIWNILLGFSLFFLLYVLPGYSMCGLIIWLDMFFYELRVSDKLIVD